MGKMGRLRRISAHAILPIDQAEIFTRLSVLLIALSMCVPAHADNGDELRPVTASVLISKPMSGGSGL